MWEEKVIAIVVFGRTTKHFHPHRPANAAMICKLSVSYTEKLVRKHHAQNGIKIILGKPQGGNSYVLERHDWRRVKPRKTHPKADPAAQEAYKKNM
jgi:hypothetical protein